VDALYLLGTRALTYLLTYLLTQLIGAYKTGNISETVEDIHTKVTINGLYLSRTRAFNNAVKVYDLE